MQLHHILVIIGIGMFGCAIVGMICLSRKYPEERAKALLNAHRVEWAAAQACLQADDIDGYHRHAAKAHEALTELNQLDQ